MKKKSVLWLVLGTVISLIVYWIYRQHFLHISFVDEEDYFLIGKYLINGTKLYSKYFSHHQPGAYVISGIIQKISEPNTIYLLVKRHRQFMALWAMGWCLFLVHKYKFRGLLAVLAIEIISVTYFKNMFLPESLVIYPLVFGVSQIFDDNFDNFWWAVCVSFVSSLLAPLWPIVLALFLIKLWIKRKNKREVLKIILGGLIPWLILLPILNVKNYINDAILVNLRYYVPQVDNGSWWSSATRLISLIFAKSVDIQVVTIKAFLVILWIGVISQYKPNKTKVILMLLLIILTDTRRQEITKTGFDGFHGLPWIAMIIWTSIKILPKKLAFLPFLLILYMTFGFRNNNFIKRDLDTDYYVHYSQQLDIAEPIKIMKNEDSKAFVVPDKPLIYWHSDTTPPNRFVFFYKWMNNIDFMKQEVAESLNNENFDFWVYPDKNADLPGFENYLADNYTRLKRKDKYVNLYVKQGIIDGLSDDQKSKLSFYNYEY